MMKRPWCIKTNQDPRRIKPAKEPGDCVSVDQLESSTPAFVVQLKGNLTKRCYRASTVFINHFFNVTYIYEQSLLTLEETVAAKVDFEAWSRDKGVIAKHYHAYNVHFADSAFMSNCQRKGQTISYCAVNSHRQNGRVEKCIRDLQEEARKLLLHAQACWPEAGIVNLWAYALWVAVEVHNTLSACMDGSCPLSRYAKVGV
eukprot:10193786-Ditylum_brightwellii.AAC.1